MREPEGAAQGSVGRGDHGIGASPNRVGGTGSSRGSDDPAGHDAGDDHGGTVRPSGSDDPAGHDAGDDHGGTSGGHGSDD